MSVFRLIVVSLINGAEYTIVPSVEHAQENNRKEYSISDYYNLLNNEGMPTESVYAIEHSLMTSNSSVWHTIVAPLGLMGEGTRVRINPQHVVSVTVR